MIDHTQSQITAMHLHPKNTRSSGKKNRNLKRHLKLRSGDKTPGSAPLAKLFWTYTKKVMQLIKQVNMMW